jgi:hypothetical protein
MAGRFCTMLDWVDTGFISDGMLDELPMPSQIGATRTGGIDLDKPRSRGCGARASSSSDGQARRLMPEPAS